jgi:hypothetical protein
MDDSHHVLSDVFCPNYFFCDATGKCQDSASFCTTKWTKVVMFCQMFSGDSPENNWIGFFQNATSKFQDGAGFCVTKWMTVVMFCQMFSGDSLENVLIFL